LIGKTNHVTFGILEVEDTFGKTLAKNLIELLKIITYVKNEVSNLNIIIVALKIVASYDILHL
jgi:hypothetical protein